jgi:hypothetical protein
MHFESILRHKIEKKLEKNKGKKKMNPTKLGPAHLGRPTQAGRLLPPRESLVAASGIASGVNARRRSGWAGPIRTSLFLFSSISFFCKF